MRGRGRREYNDNPPGRREKRFDSYRGSDKERDKDRDNRDKDRDKERDNRDKDRDNRDKDRDKERDNRDKDRDRDKDRERRRSDKDKREGRRERSGSRERRKGRSSERDQRRRSRSGSSDSPIPDLVRRKKTGWDVMIIEAETAVLPPAAPTVNPQQQRQQRRLYVGNLPPSVQEIELMEFFNTAMLNANVLTQPGSPVISAAINREKAYAFIEFRTAEEASFGMSLDGIMLQAHALRVRRPKDYQPLASDVLAQYDPTEPPIPDLLPGSGSAANLYIVSTNVADTPYKIFIGALPPHLNEGDVKKLLSMFGQLKAFNLVRDSTTGLSKGFAFCEYADPNITDMVCASLNGMAIGDKTLVVQRASVNARNAKGDQVGEMINTRTANMLNLSTPAAQLLATAVKNATADPTRILVLMNIINLSDFPGDNEESEYQEFIEDITEECARYGKVNRIFVPRPTTKQKNHTVEHFDGNDWDDVDDGDDMDEEESVEDPPPPGFGKVFVEYEKIEHAKRAQTALSGRRYDGRMVITSFHPEEKWVNQVYDHDEMEPLYPTTTVKK